MTGPIDIAGPIDISASMASRPRVGRGLLLLTLIASLTGCTSPSTGPAGSSPSGTPTQSSSPVRSAGPTVSPAAVTRACSALPDGTALAQNPGLPGGAPALAPSGGPVGPPLAASRDGLSVPTALMTARSGRDREAGERSARDFLAVLLDSRPPLTGKQVVCALAGPDLSPAVGQFLAIERNTLRNPAAPANRRLLAGGDGFYRSVAIGGEATPTTVRVELAVPVQADRPSYTAWTIYRVEVGYVPDLGWRLTDYGDNGAGPSGRTLSPKDQARFLTGPGWRPLGPAT